LFWQWPGSGYYHYAGTDRFIMESVGMDYCDQVLPGAQRRSESRAAGPVEMQFTRTASNPWRIGSVIAAVAHSIFGWFEKRPKRH
jgi:hypothetical protein